MNRIKLRSPAKINLYLKVLGRLPNGYHQLLTVFHRISLCDQISLTKSDQGFFLETNQPKLSCGEDNLITKAYRALQEEVPNLGGVRVFLRKKIPIGAGLGGGSGNAAAFLLGMNRLYQLGLSVKKLTQIGSKLGADVAFFIQNVNQALGRGVGDQLISKTAKKKYWFVLALSDKPLSTQEVYQNLTQVTKQNQEVDLWNEDQKKLSIRARSLKVRKRPLDYARPFGKLRVVVSEVEPGQICYANLTSEERVVKLLFRSLEKGSPKQISEYLVNDLEASAFALRPEIQKTIRCFHKVGLSAVRMSGSGPTVFALVENQREALSAVRNLRKRDTSREYRICQTF